MRGLLSVDTLVFAKTTEYQNTVKDALSSYLHLSQVDPVCGKVVLLVIVEANAPGGVGERFDDGGG